MYCMVAFFVSLKILSTRVYKHTVKQIVTNVSIKLLSLWSRRIYSVGLMGVQPVT